MHAVLQRTTSTQGPRRAFTLLGILSILAASLTGEVLAAEPDAAGGNIEADDGSGDAQEDRRRFWASIGLGVDFSRGDYNEPEVTNAFSIPAYIKLEWEPVTFRVSVPFVAIDGSENILGGTDRPGATGGGTAGRRFDYGLGDVVTSLTYTYFPQQQGIPFVDLTAKVKIPTADEGLGTGKTDVTLQAELTEMLGPFSVFGGLGYRFKGGADFDDVLIGSAGMGYRFTRSLSAGFAYDWRQASVSGVSDSQELTPYLSIRTSDKFRIGPYLVIGLSSASPDWGLGSSFTYTF